MELVERGTYLAALGEHLDAAAAAGGRLVLVGGEAGVGKTSLVRRFADEHAHETRVRGRMRWSFTPEPLAPLRDLGLTVAMSSLGLVVEEAIEPMCRADLHARALQALVGSANEARLGHHAERAGDANAVLEHARTAAEQAAGTELGADDLVIDALITVGIAEAVAGRGTARLESGLARALEHGTDGSCCPRVRRTRLRRRKAQRLARRGTLAEHRHPLHD